jgi:hypothetical protein
MQAFRKTLSILRVIILALAAGLTVVGAVMIYMVIQVKPGGFIGGAGPQLAGLPLMTIVMDGISLVILLLSFFLPPVLLNIMTRNWARKAQPIEGDLATWETTDLTWLDRVPGESLQSLLNLFHTNRIVSVALCEAAGMISVIAYLLEANFISLALLIASIAMMIWRIPTQSTLNNWVYAQMERLKREN